MDKNIFMLGDFVGIIGTGLTGIVLHSDGGNFVFIGDPDDDTIEPVQYNVSELVLIERTL